MPEPRRRGPSCRFAEETVQLDTGIRRPVLVDLRKKRGALTRGEMPPVDAGWARGANGAARATRVATPAKSQ